MRQEEETNDKIIIENKCEWLNLYTAIEMVNKVIRDGRASNGTYGKQFCFLTTFKLSDGTIAVSCEKRKSGTQKFILSEYGEKLCK